MEASIRMERTFSPRNSNALAVPGEADDTFTCATWTGRIRSPASLSRRSREQIHADILQAIRLVREASLNRIMITVFLNRNQTRRHLFELVQHQLVTRTYGRFAEYSLTDKGIEVLTLYRRIQRAYRTTPEA